MLVSPEKVFPGGSETRLRDNEFSYEVKLQITINKIKSQLTNTRRVSVSPEDCFRWELNSTERQ